MAPLRRMASVALGVACCMVSSMVAAQDDTPAPILISGFDNPDASADPLAPVFLPGVSLEETDGEGAAPAAPAAGSATENVLLANGSAGSDNTEEPIFLPGVFIDGSNDGASASLTPSSAPPASAAPATAAPNVLLADGSSTGAPAAVVGGDMVLGGWPTMPVGDTEIAFLVSSLSDVKLYNPALSFGVCMKDIFKLEYQSVSGTNFRYSGHGCLVQKGSSSMGACTVECAIEQLSVTIFTQEWTNTVEVVGIARLQMTE